MNTACQTPYKWTSHITYLYYTNISIGYCDKIATWVDLYIYVVYF